MRRRPLFAQGRGGRRQSAPAQIQAGEAEAHPRAPCRQTVRGAAVGPPGRRLQQSGGGECRGGERHRPVRRLSAAYALDDPAAARRRLEIARSASFPGRPEGQAVLELLGIRIGDGPVALCFARWRSLHGLLDRDAVAAL
ncbi:MAG: hypothetical protein WC483_06460 [Candidatus Paceibacterota bacterium]